MRDYSLCQLKSVVISIALDELPDCHAMILHTRFLLHKSTFSLFIPLIWRNFVKHHIRLPCDPLTLGVFKKTVFKTSSPYYMSKSHTYIISKSWVNTIWMHQSITFCYNFPCHQFNDFVYTTFLLFCLFLWLFLLNNAVQLSKYHFWQGHQGESSLVASKNLQ